jgi:hypothetical protein
MAYGDELQRDLLFASVQNTDNAFNQACLANDQALRESGYLLGAVRLQGKSTTATARVQDSVLSFTDGPLRETQEQLVALYFINARDFNEAVRVAAQLPQVQRGPIEVRSMLEFDWPLK